MPELIDLEERVRATFGPRAESVIASAHAFAADRGMPVEQLLELALFAGPASLDEFENRAAAALPASLPATRS